MQQDIPKMVQNKEKTPFTNMSSTYICTFCNQEVLCYKIIKITSTLYTLLCATNICILLLFSQSVKECRVGLALIKSFFKQNFKFSDCMFYFIGICLYATPTLMGTSTGQPDSVPKAARAQHLEECHHHLYHQRHGYMVEEGHHHLHSQRNSGSVEEGIKQE